MPKATKERALWVLSKISLSALAPYVNTLNCFDFVYESNRLQPSRHPCGDDNCDARVVLYEPTVFQKNIKFEKGHASQV
jgi:hypothetical protein